MNQGLPKDTTGAANGCERLCKEPLACARGSVSGSITPFTNWQHHINHTWPDVSQRRIELHSCISSTQNMAKDLITTHGLEADGAIVVADEQTHGRGRLGRTWSAPPGTCVLMSRVSIGPTTALHVESMSLASAVAVAEALELVTQPRPINVGIKWPNDLLVGGSKIAGLLLETMKVDALHSAVIVGVGINVTFSADQLPVALRCENVGRGRPVTSLTMLGYDIDRLHVLTTVLWQLDERLDPQQRKVHDGNTHSYQNITSIKKLTQTNTTPSPLPPPRRDFDSPGGRGGSNSPQIDDILQCYRRRNVLLGQFITVRCDDREYRGQVIDMDPLEGLLLRNDHGHVVHLPAATSTIVRA